MYIRFKETNLESIAAIQTKSTKVLKLLQEQDFQHCFNQWKI